MATLRSQSMTTYGRRVTNCVNCITLARGAVAAVLLCAASVAQGQAPQDAELCFNITRNPDLAIQHCTRAIESGKFSADLLARLHYNRAVELSGKGQYDRAISDCDAAIGLNPKFSDAYYVRGNSWSSKGDSDRAIADFDSALRLNPKDKSALGARAFEWMIKGDYARAIADHDAVIQLDPKSSMSYNGRGRARLYTGDYARAIPDLQEAMKLEPSS
jgi:tetratricopeptide (TPR) repeat protein